MFIVFSFSYTLCCFQNNRSIILSGSRCGRLWLMLPHKFQQLLIFFFVTEDFHILAIARVDQFRQRFGIVKPIIGMATIPVSGNIHLIKTGIELIFFSDSFPFVAQLLDLANKIDQWFSGAVE